MRKLGLLLLMIPMLYQGQVVAQSGSDCSRADYQALVDIYYATEGWNWTTTWDFSQTYDNWHGVQVTDGCVTGLNLSNNNLRGYLPESVGGMGALRQLDLSANQLSGYIPSSIGNLSDLRVLALYRNQFYGYIPEGIGELPFLLSLNLQYNQLSGPIPSSLGNLSSLHTLALDNNSLQDAIPASLGYLRNIVFLDLGHNLLVGPIPSTFSELTTLVNLELNNNYLSDCLPDMSRYGKIETLDLSNNQFRCTFPEALLSLSSLEWLYLNNNVFYGPVLDNFGALTNLSILHLNNNLLSRSLPISISQLELLEEVYLNNNYFNGCFPNDYKKFCSIDADFSANPLLDNTNFDSFCAEGVGACDPVDVPMTPTDNTDTAGTSDPGPTGPAGPAGPTGDSPDLPEEPTEEEEPVVCLSFEIEGVTDGCSNDRTLRFTVTGGEPIFTVYLSGRVNGSATTNNNRFSISNLPLGTYQIKVTDRNGCEASQEITISSDCLTGRAVASSRNNDTYPALELSDTGITSLLQVGASFPNPFPAETNIPIFLGKSGEFQIQVFTATGQEVYQQQQTAEAGTHLITLDKEIFKEAGMYIYQIQLGDQVVKGKLLRL